MIRSLTMEFLRMLFDECKSMQLLFCLRNMAEWRDELHLSFSCRDLGCALECFFVSCTLVYTVFQYLQLKTDPELLSYMSLDVLYTLSGQQSTVCDKHPKHSFQPVSDRPGDLDSRRWADQSSPRPSSRSSASRSPSARPPCRWRFFRYPSRCPRWRCIP